VDPTTLQRACDSTERVVERITPDQYSQPTPCTEWDVRALLNHVIGTLALGEALQRDTMPAVGAAPGGLPDTDLVGDDPLKAYRANAEALLRATSDEALTRTHQTPFGEMPGSMLAGMVTLDVLVHGWDLAKATGQDTTLDDELAAHVLQFAQQTPSDEMRAPRICPAIPVPGDATTTQRLVAFLGRRP
jgi:uncharacterized protein (TIGR03086 family)